MKWNNIGDSSITDKLAWGSSVIVAPFIVNLFLENKGKLNINPDSVSSVEKLKKSNKETQIFLSIALLLTFGVGAKLIHRIFTCSGGMTKPMIIQLVIIGIASVLYLLSIYDLIRSGADVTIAIFISQATRLGWR